MENIENTPLQQAESPNALPTDTLSNDTLLTDNSTTNTLSTDDPSADTLPQVEKITLKNASKIFSQISLALLLYLAVASLGQIITAFVAGMFFPDIMQNKIAVPLFTFLPQYLLAFPLTLLIFRKIKYTPHPKTKLSVGNLLGFSAVSYGGMLITNIATLALVSLIMSLLSKTAQNPLEALVGGSIPLLNILFVGLIAPIVEEILFRKMIIDRVAKYGELTAVIFSGIVFGLFH
ncbi:MAG: type II CAAX endopeptidase family protein, partial [Oscillospiraceae bacterium]